MLLLFLVVLVIYNQTSKHAMQIAAFLFDKKISVHVICLSLPNKEIDEGISND